LLNLIDLVDVTQSYSKTYMYKQDICNIDIDGGYEACGVPSHVMFY